MTNTERLAEIDEREQAATPGPWKAEYDIHGSFVGVSSNNSCVFLGDETTFEYNGIPTLKDINFIAHAREDIPFLRSEVDRLTTENAELKELKLLELHQLGGQIDMSVEGLSAKTFMASLIGMFEAAKATNYLTITVDYNEHHYGITIQKADGELTPEEKIAELEAENAALKGAQRWIPVGERLPTKKDADEYGNVLAGHMYEDGSTVQYTCNWGLVEDNIRLNNITHWMPLPRGVGYETN